MFEFYGDILSADETADALGICPAVVRQLCREGKLKAAKAGTRWLIPKRDLIAFIEQGGTARV